MRIRGAVSNIAKFFLVLVLLVLAAWAAGALYYDFPVASLRAPLAVVFTVATVAALFLLRGIWRKAGVVLIGFAVVLCWWLTLQPRQDRQWQPDVDRTAWAEVQDDTVTLHDVRNCDYRTETDFTPRWEERTIHLSKLTGIDLFINYWGSPWMAHPIVSFQFEDAPPLAFSIETRKEAGESYSAIGGLYRQYELIYLVSDERDVVRVRTNFRKGEDVYLYRLNVTPSQARVRFLEYMEALNALHKRPQWYNAVTANCTTSIRAQHAEEMRSPWDWRMLLNGKSDEMLYEHGALVTGGLPFAELKKRAQINAVAQKAGDAPDFSVRIREGMAGFGPGAEKSAVKE